jgi:hypothetical protein
MHAINGFDSRIVFSLWMGENEMSEARSKCLLSIQRKLGCPSMHITLESLSRWCHPEFPLHPAFPYLSAVHRSDYMRCYLLHVYGGGYTDVKETTVSWCQFFDALASSPSTVLGYTEIGAHGVARVGGQLEATLKENWQKLIGMCAMILKPRTEFTHSWYSQLHRVLDGKLAELKANPARHPQDHRGAQFTDGTVSPYPIYWTEILGNILHPLIFQHSESILHASIAPSFSSYR